MNENIVRMEAHTLIDHVFCDLLPASGLTMRPEQVELSHQMLNTMLRGEIALCDAGTGIGKTLAYLTAGTAFLQYRAKMGLEFQPLMISTSSIALQRAIQREYLPQLSAALLENRIIQTPILAVIRKGKSHYVCDQRLERRLLRAGAKNEQNYNALLALENTLDLDSVSNLTDYDKKEVCVPTACICRRESCRYQRFLETCESGSYSVQICNHNLLLADAIHRRTGRVPIFPDYCALIMDEAHKLGDAARQMFGATLSAEDFGSVEYALKRERYLLAAEYLTEAAEPLIEMLNEPPDQRPFSDYENLLVLPYQILLTIQKQLSRQGSPMLRRGLGRLVASITAIMTEDSGLIRYAEVSDTGGTLLCAAISNLAPQLKSVLWSQPQGIILTSGTLAVNGVFTRFREETGLSGGRVTESVTPSPFDYLHNCLLYLPQYPPEVVNGDQSAYYDALAGEIAQLLNAAHGHALVLFTAYRAMSAVQQRLSERKLWYTIHVMGRNGARALEEFRSTPGSVLLASGPVWEGMDFSGDCVSLLVIPKLPFPRPDALSEAKRKEYPSTQDYIQDCAVPEMQQKLRQGFGRAIRTETDSCVIAILDSRAAVGHKYHAAMLEALPEMPMTSDLEDVERFIWGHKSDQYFREGNKR